MAASGLTRAEKKAQTRHQLIEAAAVVFARRGFDGASLDEIAEGAGLTRGAYYAHFASKEELLAAVVDSVSVAIDLSMFDDQTLSFVEQIRAFGDSAAKAAAAAAKSLEIELEVVRLARHNKKVRSGVTRMQRQTIEALAATLDRRAEESNVELRLPAADLATAMLALMRGLLITGAADRGSVPSELFGAALVALITHP